MITKLEWQEWKSHKITLKLLNLMEIGKQTAIEELVQHRKTIGDFHRGAIFSYEDIKEEILKGDNIVEVDEE